MLPGCFNIFFLLLSSRRVRAVPRPTDLAIRITRFSIHNKPAPLVSPLVFIYMFPLVPHTSKYHTKRSGRPRARILPRDKYAIGFAIIRTRSSINCFITIPSHNSRRLRDTFQVCSRPNAIRNLSGNCHCLFFLGIGNRTGTGRTGLTCRAGSLLHRRCLRLLRGRVRNAAYRLCTLNSRKALLINRYHYRNFIVPGCLFIKPCMAV